MLSSEKSIAKSEQLLSALPAIVFEAKTHPVSGQFILNYVNRNMIGLLGFDPKSFKPANFSRKDFETLLRPSSGDPDFCVPEDDTRRFHRQFRLVVPGKGERWLDIIAD